MRNLGLLFTIGSPVESITGCVVKHFWLHCISIWGNSSRQFFYEVPSLGRSRCKRFESKFGSWIAEDADPDWLAIEHAFTTLPLAWPSWIVAIYGHSLHENPRTLAYHIRLKFSASNSWMSSKQQFGSIYHDIYAQGSFKYTNRCVW